MRKGAIPFGLKHLVVSESDRAMIGEAEMKSRTCLLGQRHWFACLCLGVSAAGEKLILEHWICHRHYQVSV
jgi:hypothetical protein